jgi:hypothetical protein
VRLLRRRAASVSGRIELVDGTVQTITRASLTRDLETALRLLSACVVALAVALVLLRVT